MEFLNEKEIKLNKPLNDLDKEVIHFVKIIEKYTEYIIISGYVSILFGRTRGTEDIDIFIKNINYDKFEKLYEELKNKGYWCLNAEEPRDVYGYLTKDFAIRFARTNEIIPNFEVKIAKKPLQIETFQDGIKVITNEGTIKISSIERQIAFKRYYLKSDKDIEDAEYLYELFKDQLDDNKIKECKKRIEYYGQT